MLILFSFYPLLVSFVAAAQRLPPLAEYNCGQRNAEQKTTLCHQQRSYRVTPAPAGVDVGKNRVGMLDVLENFEGAALGFVGVAKEHGPTKSAVEDDQHRSQDRGR